MEEVVGADRVRRVGLGGRGAAPRALGVARLALPELAEAEGELGCSALGVVPAELLKLHEAVRPGRERCSHTRLRRAVALEDPLRARTAVALVEGDGLAERTRLRIGAQPEVEHERRHAAARSRYGLGGKLGARERRGGDGDAGGRSGRSSDGEADARPRTHRGDDTRHAKPLRRGTRAPYVQGSRGFPSASCRLCDERRAAGDPEAGRYIFDTNGDLP